LVFSGYLLARCSGRYVINRCESHATRHLPLQPTASGLFDLTEIQFDGRGPTQNLHCHLQAILFVIH